MHKIAVVTTRNWALNELGRAAKVTAYLDASHVRLSDYDGLWLPISKRNVEAVGLRLPGTRAIEVLGAMDLLAAPSRDPEVEYGDSSFWKIVDYKDERFRPTVHRGRPGWLDEAISVGYEVICHEAVRINREWRVYVTGTEVSDPAPYLCPYGDYGWGIDHPALWDHETSLTSEGREAIMNIARRAGNAVQHAVGLKSVVVDVGEKGDGQFGVVEVNHPSTSAWYGSSMSAVVEAITAN